MAKPRVFISSTYYDLRNVRADLERFTREVGYEPVLNERGQIPYHTEKQLEDACYKEIELCDMLVSIVGGRYGTESKEAPYSISQKELKSALDLGKPVYVFIEKNVLAEYRTYEKNKNVKGVNYVAVDDVRIYKFLEEVHVLPLLQPVASFESSRDITDYLKEQWSGLFQRMLQESARQREVQFIRDIQSTLSTLNQLVTFLTEERSKGDQAIRDILLSNHPLFQALRKHLNVSYRVYFVNLEELNVWLDARKTHKVDKEFWDTDDYMEWTCEWFNEKKLLKIKASLFEEDGRLKTLTPEEWHDSYVTLEDRPEDDIEDDDITF